MKRLPLSVAFAVVVAAGFSAMAFGSRLGFWLLFWPMPVVSAPPPDDEIVYRVSAAALSLLTSAALCAPAAYPALGRRGPRRFP